MWSYHDPILNSKTFINGHIILDLDPISNMHIGIHVDAFTYIALAPNHIALPHLRLVPDARPCSDLRL